MEQQQDDFDANEDEDARLQLNPEQWFIKFAALLLFIIPITVLQIQLNTRTRVVALIIFGIVLELAFLKFATKAAALQANQDLRAPCGILTSGFQGTNNVPKLFQMPGFIFLIWFGPKYAFTVLLYYPLGETGGWIGLMLGSGLSFFVQWIVARFMTIAAVQNAQCQPGELFTQYGAFNPPSSTGAPSGNPIANIGKQDTDVVNTKDTSSQVGPTRKRKSRAVKKQNEDTSNRFQPPSDYQQYANHHFTRGVQHANNQLMAQSAHQQRIAAYQSRAQASRESIHNAVNPLNWRLPWTRKKAS